MEKCETKTIKSGCCKKCTNHTKDLKGFDSILDGGKKLSIRELVYNISECNNLIKGLKADLEAYKKELIELMKCKGVDKYMSKSVSVSYIPSNVSYVFNAKEFKEMQRDLYQEFLTKRKEVGESVRVRERK